MDHYYDEEDYSMEYEESRGLTWSQQYVEDNRNHRPESIFRTECGEDGKCDGKETEHIATSLWKGGDNHTFYTCTECGHTSD